LLAEVAYIHGTAEELVQQRREFDVVIASEVLEHVEGPGEFLNSLSKLARRHEGLVVVSTLNRTTASYLGAILAAEHIFNVAPKGTHDWKVREWKR